MLLLLVILGVLYAFWAMLRFTFGLIERAHQRMRDLEQCADRDFPTAHGRGPWKREEGTGDGALFMREAEEME